MSEVNNEESEEQVGWLLLDLNSYFASVEQQLNPRLRGKPVAVVPMMADSTCCIAASYEAKAFGIKTGTMVGEAKKMCPHLILVTGHHEKYIEYHHKIIAAIENCHPVSQVLSIDEMACKLGGRDRKISNALELAQQIKRSVLGVGSQLTSSVGIAPNRFLAKLASDMQKPNGLTVLRKSDLPSRILPLKLRDLCGIGQNMELRLNSHGIVNMQQLWNLSPQEMIKIWGGIGGERFYRWLRGEDFLIEHEGNKSIGHSHVLGPEFRNESKAYAVTQKLLYKAGVRMRKLNFWTRRVSLSVRFLDRTRWGEEARIDDCQDDLTLKDVLRHLWQRKPKKNPLKVSITLSDFIHDSDRTLSLFENTKRVDLTRAMDELNSRYGRQTIYFASVSEVRSSAPVRIAFTNIPDPEV